MPQRLIFQLKLEDDFLPTMLYYVVTCLTLLPGLDIRPVGPVARGASRFENVLAPQKTDWPPKKTNWPIPKTKLVR